jgi:hypothetical protein
MGSVTLGMEKEKMNTWIDVYQKNYKSLLDRSSSGIKRGLKFDVYNRSRGYELIFENLLRTKLKGFQIIETGTIRNPMNWKDGNSGFLFAEFVKMHEGFVRSVDIDQNAVNTANKFVDNRYYKAHCSDSVSWLSSLQDLNNIDLFYLDSYDVEWANDDPSADHHLKEFLVIEPFLISGKIVAIDDNSFLTSGKRTGKGRKIVEYLESKSILPIYDEYQIIYRF